MNNNREAIEQFVDSSVVAKRDYQLLDILWTLSYCLSLTSTSAFSAYRPKFNKWLETTCKRNLQMKHKSPQFKEKMNIFRVLLNSMPPDFLSYETYYEDKELLDKILKNRTSMMLAENTEERLRAISPEFDAQILSFVLRYVPNRIKESLQKAEERRAMNKSYSDKYEELFDFRIRESREAGEISHFEIGTQEWTCLFNVMFDKELREYGSKSKSSEQYDDYSFWQFGDELVKLGAGYWAFLLTSSDHVRIHFMIPKFIYDVMQPYKEKLPQIEDFSSRVAQITKERVKRERAQQVESEWAADEKDTEVVSETSEIEIEDSIVSNPNILEDGLEMVGRQFSTTVGFIDILFKDKNENFVVVELKKGIGSFQVVGQIQKYMVWVDDNYAKGKQVRGIIVAKTYDEQLEHAIRGSKFPIELKIFRDEAPIQGNIKYCDSCGKENRMSAKYCAKCRKEFWL